jgi:electron transfer flavoprotein beta subunit
VKIVVCVKQTVDMQQVRIRKETRKPVLENIPLTLSNIDKNALEEAVRLKEKGGAKVIALSVGPDTLDETIKEALAMGADEAVLVTAPELNGAESAIVATVLATAVQQLEGCDLILLGEGSADNYSGQVGPRLAELLNLPQVTFVKSMEVAGRTLKTVRSLEDFFEEVDVGLPALVTVVSEINEPRIPSVTQILRAGKKPRKNLKPADLQLNIKELGRFVETLSNLAPAQERKRVLLKEGLKEMPSLVKALEEEGLMRR